MDTESLVETLEEAGLSPYQANAYVALLELGVGSATEVARAGDVPSPRIYDVLRALEERGYVETYEQGTLRARAHSPSDVVDDLVARSERLERAAEEVEERWDQPELEENAASIVRRFQTVLERASSFVDDASHQILLAATLEDFRKLAPHLREAHERGVSVRIVINTERDAPAPDASAFEEVCREVRHRPLPGPFVALADHQQSCFAHIPKSYDQYGVLVNDRAHTYVFYWYFLTSLWDPWDPIHSEEDGTLPVEYLDVRHCVQDLRTLDLAEREVSVRVEGYDVGSGEKRDLTGTLLDIECPFELGDGEHVTEMAGQVTLVLDVDGEQVTVGGWGAMIEDVEATRLTLVDVEPPVAPSSLT